MANVLIIEDDAALQEAYSFMLSLDGHALTSAYNGNEGLDETAKQTFDIILLDIHMPIMNGIQFLEQFKDSRPETTRVIVFSNMIEPEIEKQVLELCADMCILKSSATPSSILAQVQELAP